MKKILKISVVAALVLGAVSTANAAKNAVVTISGMVLAATCDVTTPGSGGRVDTGNYQKTAFKPSKDHFPEAGIGVYVPESERHFSIALANCDEENKEADKVKLYVTGNTLSNSGGYIFNAEKDKEAGIALTYKEGGAVKTVKAESTIPVHVAAVAKPTDKLKVNDSAVDFTAYMVAKAEPTASQTIDVPITFSYAYN
ncbi:fimbrial protein [Photorhabdus tasmaniensis]|uniref:Fimbrial-type adhesion domain-containing protein n=1 Tax=Photorhabdus tasmaniensis TaxID=1004159 RepID=A0ABX0GGD6_9GAMM|nr:fimbrial protein [Photorhabdus tasmaniensis]NHB88204.1 hypothetical protein [Photorhabdus tasmaniensis]